MSSCTLAGWDRSSRSTGWRLVTSLVSFSVGADAPGLLNDLDAGHYFST